VIAGWQARTSMSAPSTVFVAKCYWPGVTERHLRDAGERAMAASQAETTVGYLGSMLFLDDELVLALFRAPSRAVARSTSERAGIPCERLMESRWLPAPSGADQEEQS
jgi:hypothetical protein